MFGNRLSDDQLEHIRQYSRDNKLIELDERKNFLGGVHSIEVKFFKSSVGTAYQDRFENHPNTIRNTQSRDIAADITNRLYPSIDNNANPAHEAYAGK